MTRSTFIQEDGTRLIVEPSHTFRNVRLWISGTGNIVTVPVEHTKAVALAIQAAAQEIAEADRITGAEG